MGFLWSKELKPQQILQKLQQKHKQRAGQLFKKYGGDEAITKESYVSKLGELKDIKIPDYCHIEDQQCQYLLKDAVYDFKSSLGLKEKSLELFYHKDYTLEELLDSIYRSVEQDQRPFLETILKKAKQNQPKFVVEFGTDNKTAYGCCLALAYYTGKFQKSVERTSNILIRLVDVLDLIKRSSQAQDKICISYWLLKSISYFHIYIGKVTRCIDFRNEEEEQDYTPGNLITWLQYSSSSQGNYVSYSNQKRKVHITIFSTTGRAISKYSQFQSEKQVIFKPFTHFLVIKKQKIEDKLLIQMREISIGLASFNILWVDEKIFTPGWAYKKIMQKVTSSNPKINFITKSSTKGAFAFMNSEIGKNRRKAEFRIVINFWRQRQQGDYKASAIFLKELEDIGIVNLKILILAPDAKAVQTQMKKLVIRQYFVKITNSNEQLQKFIFFQ